MSESTDQTPQTIITPEELEKLLQAIRDLKDPQSDQPDGRQPLRISLTPSDLSTILTALYLAGEWELTVIDAYTNGRSVSVHPDNTEVVMDSLEQMRKFRRLTARIKRGIRKSPEVRQFFNV